MKKKFLNYGFDVDIRLKPFNPPIKNRIMAFNSKVHRADGEIGLFVSQK